MSTSQMILTTYLCNNSHIKVQTQLLWVMDEVCASPTLVLLYFPPPPLNFSSQIFLDVLMPHLTCCQSKSFVLITIAKVFLPLLVLLLRICKHRRHSSKVRVKQACIPSICNIFGPLRHPRRRINIFLPFSPYY